MIFKSFKRSSRIFLCVIGSGIIGAILYSEVLVMAPAEYHLSWCNSCFVDNNFFSVSWFGVQLYSNSDLTEIKLMSDMIRPLCFLFLVISFTSSLSVSLLLGLNVISKVESECNKTRDRTRLQV